MEYENEPVPEAIQVLKAIKTIIAAETADYIGDDPELQKIISLCKDYRASVSIMWAMVEYYSAPILPLNRQTPTQTEEPSDDNGR